MRTEILVFVTSIDYRTRKQATSREKYQSAEVSTLLPSKQLPWFVDQGALIPFVFINILTDAEIAAILCGILYRRQTHHAR